MTKFSPLAIAGIAVGSLIGLTVILYGGTKVASKKLGADAKTIYSVWKNPTNNTAKARFDGSSSPLDAVSDLVDETGSILSSSSKGGGTKKHCKKGGKRKTKGKGRK
jgi:hypothetical protein